MNVLTCDDKPYQMIRVGTQNSGPQDLQFTPDEVLGVRIAQYGVQGNPTELTGTGTLDYSTTSINPIASGNFIVWASIGYNSGADTTVFSVHCDQDSVVTDIASLTQTTPIARANDRQMGLFGVASMAIEPLTFRVNITAAAAALTFPIGNVRIMWVGLAGPYVAPPPPPP